MSDFPHWYDEDDDEVEALWTGRLSMDRVLQTLRDEITSRLAAEKRVQELEAQLAAQEWRPVTEPPIEDGWYDVYAPDFKDYGEFQDTARWERSEWFVYGEPISPTHWAKLRPAPTPPPAATE